MTRRGCKGTMAWYPGPYQQPQSSYLPQAEKVAGKGQLLQPMGSSHTWLFCAEQWISTKAHNFLQMTFMGRQNECLAVFPPPTFCQVPMGQTPTRSWRVHVHTGKPLGQREDWRRVEGGSRGAKERNLVQQGKPTLMISLLFKALLCSFVLLALKPSERPLITWSLSLVFFSHLKDFDA